ncbi:CGNR zinc finger domain-containing protein [Enterococcus saccharolyticus]|nr:CGNR zinc finger domain-containing protein [Enterococcus saccharolyticus]
MTNEAQLNDAVTIQFSYLQSWIDSLNMLKEITNYRTELAEKLAAFMNGVISKEMLKERIETDLQQAAFILHFFKNKKIIVPTETHFEGFKSVILLHLYGLIETNDIEKLCHCANPDCILVFINKTGKRKWCSMKICGNRHKVERFSKKSTSKKQGDDIHKT